MFSLVFLTWNAENFILKTLRSVDNQDFDDYEVIIVDNNSDDQTVDLVEGEYGDDDRFSVIRNRTNVGFSEGTNKGIEAAAGDYVCCYNHDTLLSSKYLSTLSSIINQNAVWTTARVNYRVSSNSQSVRCLTSIGFTIPYLVEDQSGTITVNFVPGDGIIIPQDIVQSALDGSVFDPTLPTKGEDIDLSLRLARKGIEMKCVLDTYSIHPDREDMYAPKLGNLLRLMNSARARSIAYRRNGFGLYWQLVALLSVLTNPFVIYFTEYPRSFEGGQTWISHDCEPM